ncbi:MAG TPA: hypothetical protein VIY86_04895, partial [Pirellulaceae bacterium]
MTTTKPSRFHMRNPEFPGRTVVYVMFGLAVIAGAFAWNHQWRRGRRVLEFLGSDVAYLVRMAPDVELLELDANAAAGEGKFLEFPTDREQGPVGRIVSSLDISRA